MIIISHRGNLNGPSNYENNPRYVEETLKVGYNVEVDVWVESGNVYLGHDKPEYLIDIDFLSSNKIWCHCKNIPSVELLMNVEKVHYFWHEEDTMTITSKGYIWTYPGKYVRGGILVHKEKPTKKLLAKNIMGVCTDYPVDWEHKGVK